MDEKTILKGILDSYPYPIVFVDNDYIIRYLNRYAKYHYYQERGIPGLIGKSLFDCHDREASKERIKAAYEKMKSDGKRGLYWREYPKSALLYAGRPGRRRGT